MNDIIVDTNGDLGFHNGDLLIGFSENLHQEHILIANKGEYREFPELGVGILQMLNDDNYMNVLIEAKKNLEYDGMKINNIELDDDGNLNVDGQYK
ncbi:oxidase [Flavobacterium sp. F-65]|uniref:Oxidase n=1 Tax=Flavobacterium pisciphilum TaxID=2893755 RepID=A0ABS8MSY2_9FLAO|nr:oxidase [Flavobacterium sp. F-65]MCC9071222.1 oxidase [Flavobacterium sp. F-65]